MKATNTKKGSVYIQLLRKMPMLTSLLASDPPSSTISNYYYSSSSSSIVSILVVVRILPLPSSVVVHSLSLLEADSCRRLPALADWAASVGRLEEV